MFKKLIEWTEIDISRGRKLVMFSTVIVYLIVAIAVIILAFVDPSRITDGLVQIFAIFSGLMMTVYGFYTGTSSTKDLYYLDKFRNQDRYPLDYRYPPDYSRYPRDPYYSSYNTRYNEYQEHYQNQYQKRPNINTSSETEDFTPSPASLNIQGD